ncbi:hypothetical protein ACSHT0_08540 [Tepidicaulis sp. LMO-SS28]|uniref:hypothetical protein n=1 Tax=Tepidicaulis sp. LMO-SS28 TaxID=3447455 RepID=UPI003EDF2CFA
MAGRRDDRIQAQSQGLADEILRLARENGRQAGEDTDLAALLEDMAEGMQLNVSVLLSLSDIATPLFREEAELLRQRRTARQENDDENFSNDTR